MKIKIKMLKDVKGQDRDEAGLPMPVKLYKKDMSYEVGEDLAKAFIGSFAKSFEGELSLEDESPVIKGPSGMTLEEGQVETLERPGKKKARK
jgi:hypothetical protein